MGTFSLALLSPHPFISPLILPHPLTYFPFLVFFFSESLPSGFFSGNINIVPYQQAGSVYTCMSFCSYVTSKANLTWSGSSLFVDIAFGRNPQVGWSWVVGSHNSVNSCTSLSMFGLCLSCTHKHTISITYTHTHIYILSFHPTIYVLKTGMRFGGAAIYHKPGGRAYALPVLRGHAVSPDADHTCVLHLRRWQFRHHCGWIRHVSHADRCSHVLAVWSGCDSDMDRQLFL